MTSELILLFLYLGFIALRNAIDDPRRADRACAVLALVGVVNVPIIYFSVQVVEHAAPGRVGEPDRGAEDGGDHAHRHAGHGVRRVVLRDRRRAGARARRSSSSARRGASWVGDRRSCRRDERMSEFFAMGGYGFYVWGAYGVAALLIVVEIARACARAAAKRAPQRRADATETSR